MRNRYKILDIEAPHFITSTVVGVRQEGFHPQAITSEDMLRQKLDSIHYNPVKLGLVERPEYWRYSSAKDFSGKAGILAIDLIE